MRVRGQVGEDLFAKRVWNIQKVVIPLCDAVLTRASPGLCILLQLFDNLQTAAGTRSLVLDFPTQAFRGWSRHHDRPGLRSPPAPRRSVRGAPPRRGVPFVAIGKVHRHGSFLAERREQMAPLRHCFLAERREQTAPLRTPVARCTDTASSPNACGTRAPAAPFAPGVPCVAVGAVWKLPYRALPNASPATHGTPRRHHT